MNKSGMLLTGRVLYTNPEQNNCRVVIESNSKLVLARYGVTTLQGTTSLLLVPEVNARCYLSKLSIQDYVIVGCDRVKDVIVSANQDTSISAVRDVSASSGRNTIINAENNVSITATRDSALSAVRNVNINADNSASLRGIEDLSLASNRPIAIRRQGSNPTSLSQLIVSQNNLISHLIRSLERLAPAPIPVPPAMPVPPAPVAFSTLAVNLTGDVATAKTMLAEIETTTSNLLKA